MCHLFLGRPRSAEVNFKEWIKLKKTIALLVLLTLVLAALVSISVLYFLADCGELKFNFIRLTLFLKVYIYARGFIACGLFGLLW